MQVKNKIKIIPVPKPNLTKSAPKFIDREINPRPVNMPISITKPASKIYLNKHSASCHKLVNQSITSSPETIIHSLPLKHPKIDNFLDNPQQVDKKSTSDADKIGGKC